MAKEFQGGLFFEVFSPSNRDPFANCKLVGPHGIQKVFDKDVKSFVVQLDGIPTTTKFSMPKESKQSLSLIQRCIVFQLEVRLGQEFSMELGISDTFQTKRSLSFSTAHKELSVQPLSARIPIKVINRAQWTSFVIDVASFVNDIWKNQTFTTIDQITVCANCKLRKIFTLKNVPSSEIACLSLTESLLRDVDFLQGVDSRIQILNLNEIRASETVADAPRINSADTNGKMKLAFGTKVPTPNQQSNNFTQSSQLNSKTTPASSSKRKPVTDSKQLSIQGSTKKSQFEDSYSEETLNASRGKSKTVEKPKLEKSLSSLNGSSIKNSSENTIENNKLPHPPQSSKPEGSATRKIRLTAKTPQVVQIQTVKTTNRNKDENTKLEDNNLNESFDKKASQKDKDENSSSKILNESISDIIQTLKLTDKPNKQAKKSIGIASGGNEDNVYSFSSKPKPVEVENRQFKLYDFRKYAKSSEDDQDEHKKSVSKNKENIGSDKSEKDYFKAYEKNKIETMDSFEKRMLHEMKAQMEQPDDDFGSNLNLHNSGENRVQSHLQPKKIETPEKREPGKINKFDAIKRNQSPYDSQLYASKENSSRNDDFNTEKFNFDAVTNSYDTDTTASLSKKMFQAKNNDDEYQDEMDVSLALTNNQRNSVNFKENKPFSLHNTPVKNSPITEEPTLDSQATDPGTDDSDEEVDLLYDPALNCYYDPRTSTYYELV